ncbi:protein kinase domain-containing protein [Aureimonas jatrophae]|uniref:Serine/threonine protein kinase n=1 Tax=Aureimonas jatrophae TaxID=1166073 RepID=A0A1H0N3B4_9HYPH|nr:protein kinase [Aureimonas jatrophae]MBB3953015.1 type VI secretion system protein ImpN [Aureimonas jatrophae]SDO87153.1 serine/threonine protein kinase [Aureimonas jatrophae]
MTDPALARVADRLAALRDAIDQVSDGVDRAIIRDGVRDVLDRDAATPTDAPLIANSFTGLERLHRGASFEILLVRQRDLGTLYALKTLCPERGSAPLLRRLLLDEARHQERVRHPACLALRAALRLADGRPALLLDYVDAPTLATVLRERHLGSVECIALALRLAAALEAVHAAGLIHGDVSPANVLLPGGRAEAAILLDFGLARCIGARPHEADLEQAWTPGFAAPEARSPGAPADVTSDLFSLGRLLAVACVPDARAELEPLLGSLLQTNPSDRPQSARETIGLLATCGAKDTTHAKTAATSSNESVSRLMKSSGRVISRL